MTIQISSIIIKYKHSLIMIDFLLSLFNIWVWLFFAVLAGVTLLIVYLKYGPDEFYEPFEYKDDGIVESIRAEDEFKHINFKKIDGEWQPKINLRNYTLKEAKRIILFIMLPCVFVWSYYVNQIDHIEPNGTLIYKVKN